MKNKRLKVIISSILTVIMVLNCVVAYAVEIDSPDTASRNPKDKIQPYLLEKMEETDEKIPVWVWFEDIDHDAVEAEVFKRTGLTEDNLSVISENLPEELAIAVSKLEEADEEKREEVLIDFRAYMERTSAERAIEAERTNLYISTIRSVQQEKYQDYVDSVIRQLDISQDNIINCHLQSPSCIIYLTHDEILSLSEDKLVDAMYYFNISAKYETVENWLPGVVQASTVNYLKSQLGLDGTGVKIGIIDDGPVIADSELPQSRLHAVAPNTNINTGHSTTVAKIAAGTNGIASNADVYYSSGDMLSAIVDMSSEGVNVANHSMITERSSVYYTSEEIYLDFIARYYRFLLVNAAGNNHGLIGSPGLAYNGLTVGAFYNQSTSDFSDDIMYSGSSFQYGSGCRKPDFIADMPCFPTSNPNEYSCGTSFSAPFATGVIALLYQLKPSIMVHPDLVKAIMMSSCHRKVQPSSGDPTELMTSGWTKHQGAGAIDPYIAVSIVGSGSYGYRVMSSSSTNDTVYFNQPAYGATGMNVCIVWNKENYDGVTEGSSIDLDLELYNNNTLMKYSDVAKSSSEMVYVTPSSNNSKYRMNIVRDSNTGRPIRYAYAFSLNNSVYQSNTEQNGLMNGVYYLKNRGSGLYMQESSGSITQNVFSGGNNQQWFIYNNKIYALNTGSDKIISKGSSLSNNYIKAVTSSSNGVTFNTQNVTDFLNNQIEYIGAFRFIDSSTNKSISVYNNSSTSGALIAFGTKSASNNYQQWLPEKINYRKGDVDFNGILNATDVTFIQQYVIHSRTFSQAEKYYADVNGDGSVTNADALLLSQMINN